MEALRKTVLAGVLGLLPALVGVASRAMAGGLVGNGTPASCTEAALDAALVGGGSVSFRCGLNPTTITITSYKMISTPTRKVPATIIDGGGRIILSGGDGTGIIVNQGGVLTLANLSISGGGANGNTSAIQNYGRLTVSNSTLSNNHGAYGGAIFNSGQGQLTVSKSILSDNSGLDGGAIFNTGRLTVTDSSLINNRAAKDPGVVDNISEGGAILSLAGSLTVTRSSFSGNSADRGGAVTFLSEKFTVTDSTFSSNHARTYGGALNVTTVTVSNSTFFDNRTDSGGVGGAIACGSGSRLMVSNSTFVSNHSSSGGAVSTYSAFTLINSTFFDNNADPGGGDIFNFAGNPLIFKNTLIANSTSAENCVGVDAAADRGHNLDSGSSCRFSETRGSLSNTDPKLDPAGLAENGGPTLTLAVEADSPAIAAGKKGACRASPVKGRDQRGFARPGTGSKNCTIGAYEFNSPGPPVR